METFFGLAMPRDRDFPSAQVPIQQRDIRRGVWSSSLQEEDEWVDALLSSSSARHNDRCHNGSQADVASGVSDDFHHDATRNVLNTVIPKAIHFIWLGNNAVPSFPFLDEDVKTSQDSDASAIKDGGVTIQDPNAAEDDRHHCQWNQCMQSWKKHHPSSRGWTIRLWTERDVIDVSDRRINPESGGRRKGKQCKEVKLNLSNLRNSQGYQYAIRNKQYGMASDILRLEILNKFGGIYVDIDYWCVGNLDDIATDTRDGATKESASRCAPVQFLCSASNSGCIELNNGLMACRQGGHPILWNMMDSIHGYFKDELSSPNIPPIPQQDSIASLLSSFLDPTSVDALETAHLAKDNVSAMNVIEHCGPGLLTRSVCRWIVNGGVATSSYTPEQNSSFDVSQVMVLPSCAFHPFPNHLRKVLSSQNTERQLAAECRSDDSQDALSSVNSQSPLPLLRAFFIFRGTKAVHLWGCSWQDAQDFK